MSTPCKNFNFQRRKIHVFLTQHKSLTKKTNDVTHKHLPQASSKDLKDFWIYWDMAVTFRTLRLEEFSYLSRLCEEVWYPRLLSEAWDGIFLEEVCTCVPSHLWCSVSKYLKLKRNTYLSSYLFLNFKCQCLKRISKTLSQGTKKKNNKWWLFSIFEGCQIKIRSS